MPGSIFSVSSFVFGLLFLYVLPPMDKLSCSCGVRPSFFMGSLVPVECFLLSVCVLLFLGVLFFEIIAIFFLGSPVLWRVLSYSCRVCPYFYVSSLLVWWLPLLGFSCFV